MSTIAASVAFINIGKNLGFFKNTDCNYGTQLSEFFGSSCAPGAREFDHDHPNITNPQSLCTLCRSAITTPSADPIIPQVADDAEITGDGVLPEDFAPGPGIGLELL